MEGNHSSNCLIVYLAWALASCVATVAGCRAPSSFTFAEQRSGAGSTASSSTGLPAPSKIDLCSYVAKNDESACPPSQQSLFAGPQLADGDPLTIDEALQFALQHSDIARTVDGDEVIVEAATGYDAPISRETINEALAAFDTSLETTFAWNRFEGPPNTFFGPGIDREDRQDEATLSTGLTKLWYRGTQTRVAYNPSPGYLFLPAGASGFNPSHVAAMELEIRQPLLQGGGLNVNYAPVIVAQLETDQSAWEFKEALLEMVQNVEQAYWELYAARIAREVLEEQEPLLKEVVRVEEANIEADRSVGADLAKARTQLSQLRQRLVEANRVVREKELLLGSLMGLAPNQHVSIVPTSIPPSAPIRIDKQASIARAINNQPLLVQRRIATRVRELEILVAQNQYLPRFDLQALYRANGLDDDLGNALEMMFEQDFYDWQFGAAFSVPLGRNGPRARLRAAELELARERAELREQVRLIVYEIDAILTRIEAFHTEYLTAKEREKQAREWLRGARIRYENPPPAARSVNWMLVALNDLLFALRESTDAAEEAAVLLADYNTELARLQQVEGNLLNKYQVCLQQEPWTPEIIERLPEIKVPEQERQPQQETETLPRGEQVRAPQETAVPVIDSSRDDERNVKAAVTPPVTPTVSAPAGRLERLPSVHAPYPSGQITGVRPVRPLEAASGEVLLLEPMASITGVRAVDAREERFENEQPSPALVRLPGVNPE